MATTVCIYCRRPTADEPVEHVIPEGLVGHVPFEVTVGSVLAERRRFLTLEQDEVCGGCNGSLGRRLDSYLQAQLGLLKPYFNAAGTKSGKPASAERPGMWAERRRDGPHVALNMEQHSIVTPEGHKVSPAGSNPMAVRVPEFEIFGRHARFKIEQPVRINKRFVRALYKIGFELLCHRKGPQFVLREEYDPVRDYIRLGRGNRRIVIGAKAEIGQWERPLFSLRHDPSWPGWLAIVRLGATFYLDLSPKNAFFKTVDLKQLEEADLLLWSDEHGGKVVTP